MFAVPDGRVHHPLNEMIPNVRQVNLSGKFASFARSLHHHGAGDGAGVLHEGFYGAGMFSSDRK